MIRRITRQGYAPRNVVLPAGYNLKPVRNKGDGNFRSGMLLSLHEDRECDATLRRARLPGARAALGWPVIAKGSTGGWGSMVEPKRVKK